jgi:hypothetical protein
MTLQINIVQKYPFTRSIQAFYNAVIVEGKEFTVTDFDYNADHKSVIVKATVNGDEDAAALDGRGIVATSVLMPIWAFLEASRKENEITEYCTDNNYVEYRIGYTHFSESIAEAFENRFHDSVFNKSYKGVSHFQLAIYYFLEKVYKK